jgi:hypothetical protein
MDAEEKEICDFLKSWPGQFVSGREIARRAGGKWRFRDDPNWSTPVLIRLVEKQLIESDAGGHYRLTAKEKKSKQKRWLSPELKKILEQAGKDFAEGVDVDKPEEDKPESK